LIAAGVVAGSLFALTGGLRGPAPAVTASVSSARGGAAQPSEFLTQVGEVVAAGDRTSLGGTHGTDGGESPVTLGVALGSGRQVAFVGRVIGGPHRRLLPDFELVNYTGVFRSDGGEIGRASCRERV